MKGAISGNCNECCEGSANLLDAFDIILLIVKIGIFKDSFVSFCLVIEFIWVLSLSF